MTYDDTTRQRRAMRLPTDNITHLGQRHHRLVRLAQHELHRLVVVVQQPLGRLVHGRYRQHTHLQIPVRAGEQQIGVFDFPMQPLGQGRHSA